MSIQQQVNQLLGTIEGELEQTVQEGRQEKIAQQQAEIKGLKENQRENISALKQQHREELRAQQGQISELRKQSRIQQGQLTRMKKANERLKERQEVLKAHKQKIDEITIGGQRIDPQSQLYSLLKGEIYGNK